MEYFFAWSAGLTFLRFRAGFEGVTSGVASAEEEGASGSMIESGGEREWWTRRFCAERALGPGDPLLRTALIGDAGAVVARLVEYETAGATDLMLGFVDFPATTMLERLAAATLRPESARDR